MSMKKASKPAPKAPGRPAPFGKGGKKAPPFKGGIAGPR